MYPDLLSPIAISLKTAITATIITFCLGTMTAWWMSRYRGKGRNIIETILTAPLVLPPTVVGFLLLLSFGKNGWLGQLLNMVGIRIVFTWYATVIAATVVAFPLMYKSAYSAFEQIDRNLIDCARTLGAKESTIFWRIIFPLAKPGLVAGTLLAFARALGEFGATLMLAGSIPGKTQTIPIAIYLAAESGEMDRALGLVIVLLIISLGILLSINYGDRFTRNLFANRYRGSQASRSYIPIDNPSLEVDIQKQLPDFLLDIAFRIDRTTNPLGILGVSGSGKTTLLRCIAGLETPDRGRIVLNRRVLFDSAKGINLAPQERQVGLVWQNYALFPHLCVGENIAFGMSNKIDNAAIEREIRQQLQQVELATMKQRSIQQLSGGEKQRVALARALASKPQITLLDEPCSALNTNLKARLLKLFQQRLANYPGLTLYITHNLQEAYDLCPQLLAIERGKAIAFDRQQKIFNRPPNIATAQLIGCENISPARMITGDRVIALDWHCHLKVKASMPLKLSHVGIHAHQLRFANSPKEINTFPSWLANYKSSIDRVKLYLKLHSIPSSDRDYHLVVEVDFAKWQELQQLPAPWYLQLDPDRLILLEAIES